MQPLLLHSYVNRQKKKKKKQKNTKKKKKIYIYIYIKWLIESLKGRSMQKDSKKIKKKRCVRKPARLKT